MPILSRQTVERGFAEADRIAQGYVPGEQDLAEAPTLSDWRVQSFGDRRQLCGVVKGHPEIPDGPLTSSELLAIDEGAGWARTITRYYRLASRPELTQEDPDQKRQQD